MKHLNLKPSTNLQGNGNMAKTFMQARNQMMAETKPDSRPLSPHLQIFRPIWTMMMSIAHRITGAALYFGMILLVWWLWAASSSDENFTMAQAVFGHWFGLIILFGFTWAMIHHTLGGLRHLVWDTGHSMDYNTASWMAKATLAGSVLLTIVLWVIGFAVMP
jgi:succinate dehydrogenase / fumarate reductase, cytochrome b subunit